MLVSIPRRGQVLSLLIREQERISSDLKALCEPIVERGLEVGAAHPEERDAVRLRLRFLQTAGALTINEESDYEHYLALPEMPDMNALADTVRRGDWTGAGILKSEG